VTSAALGGLRLPVRAAAVAALVTVAILGTLGAAPVVRSARARVAVIDVANYVRTHARPGDTQYVMYAKANANYYTGLQSPYPYAWSLLVRAHPGAMPRLLHLLQSPRRPTWVIEWQRPDRWNLDPRHDIVRAPPRPPDLPPHLLPSQTPPQKEPPMTTTWVVLPTYNERENLTTVVTLARAALASCDPPVSGTVLIVDDGSPDGTGDLADHLAREHADVRVLHRARKGGLGGAYLAGFDEALANGADFRDRDGRRPVA